MPAKIFISCGQATADERKVAQDLGTWFHSKGYVPYVAIEVQSILDLNAGIIAELKTSDYYLFINFAREVVTATDGTTFRRGSMYTNQELAVAYALGFDHMLLVNQQGTRPEGVFKFIVTNIPEFATPPDVIPLIQNAVGKAGWQPSYTRQLLADNLRLDPPVNFADHTGVRAIRTLLVDVRNERPDLGALGCVARLVRFGSLGGPLNSSPDRSLLKVTGASGFAQTIWPKSRGGFDLFGISVSTATDVFLNSALDVHPRQPIIRARGLYRLEFEVFSQGFPTLNINVRLDLTGNLATTTAALI